MCYLIKNAKEAVTEKKRNTPDYEDIEDVDMHSFEDFDMLSYMLFNCAYEYGKDFKHVAYLYQQSLECHLKMFEVYTPFDLFLSLRTRIPYLLAALGYDDECMSFIRRNLRLFNNDDNYSTWRRSDVLSWNLGIEAWPHYFRIPASLVKMRVINDLSNWLKFESVILSHFPGDIKGVIQGFVVGPGESASIQLDHENAQLLQLMQEPPIADCNVFTVVEQGSPIELYQDSDFSTPYMNDFVRDMLCNDPVVRPILFEFLDKV